MSKPVSNVEIEDVLASIRRLVADDGRGSTARALSQATEPAQTIMREAGQNGTAHEPPQDARLILTPAQRVADQDAPAAETHADATVDDSLSPVAPEAQTDAAAGDPVAARDDAPDGSAALAPVLLTEPHRVPTPVDDSTADDDGTVGEDANDGHDGPIEAADDGYADAATQDAATQDDTQDDAPEAADDSMLAHVIKQELEAALQARPAAMPDLEPAPEPDAEPEPHAEPASESEPQPEAAPSDTAPLMHDAPPQPEAEPDPAQDAAASSMDRVQPRPRPTSQSAPADPVARMAHPPRSGLSLEQKIAELEAMIGDDASGEWDDDHGGQGGNAGFSRDFGSALEWEDAPGVDAIFQSRRARDLAEIADDLDEDVPGDVPASPLAGLDEAGMRDLVAEIVRSELQGVLGERITRNVRKLVRREIQRAVMSQNYD